MHGTLWDEDDDEELDSALDELLDRGWSAYHSQKYALAGELLETLLKEAESRESTYYIATASLALGCTLVESSQRTQQARARGLLQRALILARYLDWRNGSFHALMGLGSLDFNRRRWRQALLQFLQAKRYVRKTEEKLYAREYIARLAWRVRRYRAVERLSRWCASSHEQFDRWEEAATSWQFASLSAYRQGKDQEAQHYLEAMFLCAEKQGDEGIVRTAVVTQGIYALRRGRRREAESLFLNMLEFGKEPETRRAARLWLTFSASSLSGYWKYVKAFWQPGD